MLQAVSFESSMLPSRERRIPIPPPVVLAPRPHHHRDERNDNEDSKERDQTTEFLPSDLAALVREPIVPVIPQQPVSFPSLGQRRGKKVSYSMKKYMVSYECFSAAGLEL